ncbi:hypothetical protein TNCV_1452831 [Trichonephila clavipes]|nr:hypothetical protein TNCV_1452831 [Trichonephila clavipes]
MQIGRFNKTLLQQRTQGEKDTRVVQANFPDISSEEWPLYSPDLNPMDYSVWSVLESRICTKPHKTLDSLKQSLLRE